MVYVVGCFHLVTGTYSIHCSGSMNQSFYFLHHGQTDWNDRGLLMGQQDIPLNRQGRQQAQEAGKVLAGLSIATLCYSPLLRAKETAEIVAMQCPCSLFPLTELMERRWGELEGQQFSAEELSQVGDSVLDGRENLEVFKKRVVEGMKAAAAYPEPILFVSHGGVFQVICAELGLEAPQLANDRVAHFYQKLGKWHVEIIEE